MPVPLEEAKRLVGYDEPSTAPSEDIEAVVERLAAMSELEYARVRKDEANKLRITPISVLDKAVKSLRQMHGEGKKGQGREIVLPEPEPWPEEVDGAVLLDHVTAAFKRHLALPDGAAEAMTLWCLHTYCMDAFQTAPRLALTSPEKRCGKTTALTLINALVWRPLSASNITAPAVFRTIEDAQPTLILDEADTFIKNSDDLRGVLDSGHSRATGFVIRLVGDDHEPRQFATWGPVAIAAIGKIPETLEDRSILIRMRRKTASETVARLRADRLDVFQPLCQQAKRWADDHLIELRNADPEMPDNLHDRAADNWRPLLAIADSAGGAWPERARRIAVALSTDGEDASIKTQLLSDIRDILGDDDRITSADLAHELAIMEDRRWPEWKNAKPITMTQIAHLLKPFGIGPTTFKLETSKSAKGYTRAGMEDAFARYLGSQTVTRNLSQNSAGFGDIQTVTSDSEVTLQYGQEMAENSQRLRVTDRYAEHDDVCMFSSADDDSKKRAAIAEFDGGMTREEAEAIAEIDAADDRQPPPIPEFLLRTE